MLGRPVVDESDGVLSPVSSRCSSELSQELGRQLQERDFSDQVLVLHLSITLNLLRQNGSDLICTLGASEVRGVGVVGRILEVLLVIIATVIVEVEGRDADGGH